MEMHEIIRTPPSHVKAVGYNPNTQDMRVDFAGNKGGIYLNVDPEDYARLIKADRPGNYLNQVIKRKYAYQPLPNGASDLSRHVLGDKAPGYLVEDGMITSANPIKGAGPGFCPACGKPAGPWEPPVSDRRYNDRIAAIKEIAGFQTDREAHEQFLKDQGFISICECGISFYVNGGIAKLKESENAGAVSEVISRPLSS